MKKGRLVIATGAALALTLGLAACGSAQTSTSSSESTASSVSSEATSSESASAESSPAIKKENDGSVYVWTKAVAYDKTGNVRTTDERSVDEKGNTVKITTTSKADDGSGSDENTTVVSEHTDLNADGYPQTIKTPKTETNYTYTDNGTSLVKEEKNEDGSSMTTTYEYYENGGIKSETSVVNAKDGDTTITTSYDENGYITSNKVEGAAELETSYTWEFDSQMRPVSYTQHTVKGENEDVTHLIQTDDYGNIIAITDESGQPLYSFEYTKIAEPSKAAIADAFVKKF